MDKFFHKTLDILARLCYNKQRSERNRRYARVAESADAHV